MKLLNSLLQLVIGDLDEKRAYRQMWKRAKALPDDYYFVYRKIYYYMLNRGANGEKLLELFEQSAADHKQVLEVIGNDVGQFCEDFMRASDGCSQDAREKINEDILAHFNKGVPYHAETN